MRVLLVPHTGLRSIRGDSNYLLFLDIATYLISRGHFCYMILPKFAEHKVDRIPGLMYVFKEYEYDWYTEYGLIDLREMAHLFSRSMGKYFVDVIITAMAAQIPIYQLALSDGVHARDIACISIDPSVYELDDKSPVGLMSNILTYLGYAYSTPIFLSPLEKEMAVESARKCLAASDVKRISENAKILPVGVPCDYADEVTKDVEKFDKFTLFYGGRINDVKNPDKVVKLFTRFLSSGRDVQIKITTNTGRTKVGALANRWGALGKELQFIDIRYKCPREDYLKVAKASHVGIGWSWSEGFPVGWWEQMYLGLPILFWKKPWIIRQLPEWYPFVFETMEEAYSMLMYVYENYDEVQTLMERMRKFIREEYESGKIYAEIEAEIDKLMSLPQVYMKAKNIKKLILDVTKLLEPGQKVSVGGVLRLMEKAGRAFKADTIARMVIPRYPRDYEIYKMLLEVGYVDTYKRAVPELIVPDLGQGSR